VDNAGWPHAVISLTNGWRFIYRHAMVNGYYAPDVLFSVENPNLRVKNLTGKWNLSEWQAIDAARHTLAKLGFPANNIHMDFAPEVTYAQGDYQKIIPRYFFEPKNGSWKIKLRRRTLLNSTLGDCFG